MKTIKSSKDITTLEVGDVVVFGNLVIDSCGVLCAYSSGKIMFKSKESAKQAIQILGKETVKLALKSLY